MVIFRMNSSVVLSAMRTCSPSMLVVLISREEQENLALDLQIRKQIPNIMRSMISDVCCLLRVQEPLVCCDE